MPRLIFFGLSQKAIIDKMDGNVSMIVLLHALSIQMSKEQAIPPDAVLPASWAAVATWQQEAGDEDKTFQSKVEMFYPSGASAMEIISDPFLLPGKLYTSVSNSAATPVSQHGIYIVKVYLREVARESQWVEHGKAEISVEHVFQKEGQGG